LEIILILILLNKGNIIINKALLKHGHTNFTLEILAYCERDEVLKLEQFYLDILTPKYNTLKKAGSSLGYKHTVETKAKLSSTRKTLIKNDVNFKKVAIKNFEKFAKPLVILNIETNVQQNFLSIKEASDHTGIPRSTIGRYLKTQKIYKKKYLFSYLTSKNFK
jgi:Fic family protein